MKEFYTNNPRNLYERASNRKLTKKQRRADVIHNLTKTIESENLKVGSGNKELVAKLQDRLDDLTSKK